MKYIDFKHQRENKQNSDKNEILVKVVLSTITPNPTNNTSCMQRKRLEKKIYLIELESLDYQRPRQKTTRYN